MVEFKLRSDGAMVYCPLCKDGIEWYPNSLADLPTG